MRNIADLPPLIDNGQIISYNNGIITVLNSSGIFIIDPKTFKTNTGRDLLSTANFNNQNDQNPFNIYQYFPQELLNLNFEPGQTVSVNNNIVTITNSSGTFMGNINDGRIVKVSDAQSTYYGYSNINNDFNQSISIVNGIIIINNSTGSYAGKNYEKLIKID